MFCELLRVGPTPFLRVGGSARRADLPGGPPVGRTSRKSACPNRELLKKKTSKKNGCAVITIKKGRTKRLGPGPHGHWCHLAAPDREVMTAPAPLMGRFTEASLEALHVGKCCVTCSECAAKCARCACARVCPCTRRMAGVAACLARAARLRGQRAGWPASLRDTCCGRQRPSC